VRSRDGGVSQKFVQFLKRHSFSSSCSPVPRPVRCERNHDLPDVVFEAWPNPDPNPDVCWLLLLFWPKPPNPPKPDIFARVWRRDEVLQLLIQALLGRGDTTDAPEERSMDCSIRKRVREAGDINLLKQNRDRDGKESEVQCSG
jgi:hypothetical protein